MTRQKRHSRLALGPLVFLFVFAVVSAATGVWINSRYYQVEKNYEDARRHTPVQWSAPPERSREAEPQ
jgi:hypothetical protein